jgi:hypothetical protein
MRRNASAAKPTTPVLRATTEPKLPVPHVTGGRWVVVLFDDINTTPGDIRLLEFTSDTATVLAKVKTVQSHFNSINAKGLYVEAPGGPGSQSVEVTQLQVVNFVDQTRSLGDRLDGLDAAAARFAESTGGLLLRNNNDLELGFHELGIAPAYAYVLGFPPAEDGKCHRMKVEVRNGNRDLVEVRPGYFAPTTESSAQLGPEDKINSEMLASTDKTDFPVSTSENLSTLGSDRRELTVQAHFDPRQRPFQPRADRRLEMLTFPVGVCDRTGIFVTGKEGGNGIGVEARHLRAFLRPASTER